MPSFYFPDLVILLGARAWLSCFGLGLVAGGTWYADRKYDEQADNNEQSRETTTTSSSSAYQLQQDNNNNNDNDNFVLECPCHVPNEEPPSSPPPRVLALVDPPASTKALQEPYVIEQLPSPSSRKSQEPTAPSPQQQQKTTMSVLSPDVMIIAAGWLLLAVSCVCSRAHYMAWSIGGTSIAALVVLVGVALAQLVWFRRSVLQRQVHAQREWFALSLGGGLLLLSVLLALSGGGNSYGRWITASTALWWTAPLGAVCIVLSFYIYWYHDRRRGDSYDRLGISNNKYMVVFSLGGPLFAMGWFALWMGMNVVAAAPSSYYLPIVLSSRTVVAYLGALTVLLVLWMVGYALDEMPNTATYQPGFGVAGRFFGRIWEVKLAMTASWLFLGSAAFLPYIQSTVSIFLFLALVLQGIATSLLYEQAIPSQNSESVKQAALFVVASLALIVLLVAVQGGRTAALLSLIAALGLYWGQYFLHVDRKRGQYWILAKQQQQQEAATIGQAQDTVHPHPIVYTYGAPLTTIGMLLLAWAVSIA